MEGVSEEKEVAVENGVIEVKEEAKEEEWIMPDSLSMLGKRIMLSQRILLEW